MNYDKRPDAQSIEGCRRAPSWRREVEPRAIWGLVSWEGRRRQRSQHDATRGRNGGRQEARSIPVQYSHSKSNWVARGWIQSIAGSRGWRAADKAHLYLASVDRDPLARPCARCGR